MLTMALCPAGRCDSALTAWLTIRAPVAPNGWPTHLGGRGAQVIDKSPDAIRGIVREKNNKKFAAEVVSESSFTHRQTTLTDMAQTYIELMAEIERLQTQAAKLKDREKSDVVARIKKAIEVYGLTAKDLGLDKSGRAASGKRTATRKTKAGKRGTRKPKAAAAPKFRDAAGNSWSGRGPRPGWLRNALASGATLESFAVQAQ
jgi:DNA-binding protein H-NS